jgi:hypothetical protein
MTEQHARRSRQREKDEDGAESPDQSGKADKATGAPRWWLIAISRKEDSENPARLTERRPAKCEVENKWALSG